MKTKGKNKERQGKESRTKMTFSFSDHGPHIYSDTPTVTNASLQKGMQKTILSPLQTSFLVGCIPTYKPNFAEMKIFLTRTRNSKIWRCAICVTFKTMKSFKNWVERILCQCLLMFV